MSVKLLTEHHLEFLSLNGDCVGSSESIHVKMPHCWKSHVAAQLYAYQVINVLYLLIKMWLISQFTKNDKRREQSRIFFSLLTKLFSPSGWAGPSFCMPGS